MLISPSDRAILIEGNTCCVFLILKAETALGVKLEQIELNEHNISEVLRLFILARNAEPNEVWYFTVYLPSGHTIIIQKV